MHKSQKNKINEDEFAIYVHDPNVETTSLTCEICNFLLRKKDLESIANYGACLDCMMDFVEPNMSSWLDGNRPDEKLVNEKIELRKKNPFFFMRDRPI